MRHRCAAAVAAAAIALAAGTVVEAGPALDAFAQAWQGLNGYRAIIEVHERKGTQTQDRTYEVTFRKPHALVLKVVSGAGAGSGGTWDGGDDVEAHLGGLLSIVRLRMSLHDPRVTTLRGDTFAAADLGVVLDDFQRLQGTLTEAPGPPVDGVPTDAVILAPLDPSADGGVTRDELLLSRTTHLPVKRSRYVGEEVVKTETIVHLATDDAGP